MCLDVQSMSLAREIVAPSWLALFRNLSTYERIHCLKRMAMDKEDSFKKQFHLIFDY